MNSGWPLLSERHDDGARPAVCPSLHHQGAIPLLTHFLLFHEQRTAQRSKTMVTTLRCATVVARLRHALTPRYGHVFEHRICYTRASYFSSVARDHDHGKEDDNKDTPQTPVSRVRYWYKMCEKLRKFVEKNGHANVPILNPTLGRWVDTQRDQYRFRLRGDHTALTTERLEILNGLGMVWDAHEYIWEERYEELLDFYYREGHVNVPQRHKGGLGTWIGYQRVQFRSRQMGESNHSMTTERMVRLSALGMVWDIFSASWDECYQQLAEFCKEHGHANVSADAQNPLSIWVQTQRRMYKRYQEGAHSHVTPERIERLNKLGFVWDYQEAVWNEHYQELCRYRAEFGDCIVPKEYKGSATLGRWVDQQRQHYKRLKDGKSASITPERIAMLNKIEFVWNAQDALFRRRVEELREFVDVNGFGRVPPVKTHGNLAKWLQRQRRYYLMMKEGKKGTLTPERVSALRKLGFLID